MSNWFDISMDCDHCEPKCCLIDVECVLAYTPLSQATPGGQIQTAIYNAQERIAKKILNKECVEWLCGEINASNGHENLEGAAKQLYGIYARYAAWEVFVFYLEYYGNKKYIDFIQTKKSFKTLNANEDMMYNLLCKAREEVKSQLRDVRKCIEELNLDCMPCIEPEDNGCCEKDNRHLDLDMPISVARNRRRW